MASSEGETRGYQNSNLINTAAAASSCPCVCQVHFSDWTGGPSDCCDRSCPLCCHLSLSNDVLTQRTHGMQQQPRAVALAAKSLVPGHWEVQVATTQFGGGVDCPAAGTSSMVLDAMWRCLCFSLKFRIDNILQQPMGLPVTTAHAFGGCFSQAFTKIDIVYCWWTNHAKACHLRPCNWKSTCWIYAQKVVGFQSTILVQCVQVKVLFFKVYFLVQSVQVKGYFLKFIFFSL